MSQKKMMAKSKKITYKKTKIAKSIAIRTIQKTESLITKEQEKLTKQLTKFIRSADKMVTLLTAQINKMKNRKTAKTPARGRKPAKNALMLLESALANAQSESAFLKNEQEKWNAQQKVNFLFLKEWKKNTTSQNNKTKKSSIKQEASLSTTLV